VPVKYLIPISPVIRARTTILYLIPISYEQVGVLATWVVCDLPQLLCKNNWGTVTWHKSYKISCHSLVTSPSLSLENTRSPDCQQSLARRSGKVEFCKVWLMPLKIADCHGCRALLLRLCLIREGLVTRLCLPVTSKEPVRHSSSWDRT
jgi:hypothetical protein